MQKLVNFHVIDNTNIGDLHSAPSHYFDFPGFQVENRDIRQINRETIRSFQNQHIIIGGGGLASNRFLDAFTQIQLAKSNHKLIIWGIGQQDYSSTNVNNAERFNYEPFTQGFDLVGIRDSHYLDYWVPCVSCMHPSFDKKYEIEHEFVVFSHKKFQIDFPGFPHMKNSSQNLDEILNFLGSGETILTSSYHGAYWGTLLGRKVLSFPFNSKFYTFKHLPAIYPVSKWLQAKFKVSIFGKTLHESAYDRKFICNQENWQEYLPKCQIYPESLVENRDRNRWFYSQVMNLIESN
jgi:hypothetical protein